MRSYTYNGSTWQVIDDPIPQVTISTTRSGSDREFHQALSPFGFKTFGDTSLKCKIGRVTVYARDHEKLAAKRLAKEFPYDFVCLLRIGGSSIRVWLVDLSALFLFLSEIEAHPKPDDNPFERLINDEDFQRLLLALPSALVALENGDIEITVKPPKPKKP